MGLEFFTKLGRAPEAVNVVTPVPEIRRLLLPYSGVSLSKDERPAPDPELYRRVYAELKRMARHHLRGTGRVSLSTTELVHEAYLKLHGQADWEGRAHFFGAAARAMREVLVDFARRRTARKRGGDARRVSLSESDAALEMELDDILALDQALLRLAAVDERLRRIVELRFFAGFSEKEVSELLNVSSRTIEREWLKARLFLLRELESSSARKLTGPDAPATE
jgi:RNA polymerase sigma factor (TIGR02999 family)